MFSTNYIVKATLIFGAVGCVASAQDALPEGRGKAEFTRICSQCHSTTVVTRLRNSEVAGAPWSTTWFRAGRRGRMTNSIEL